MNTTNYWKRFYFLSIGRVIDNILLNIFRYYLRKSISFLLFLDGVVDIGQATLAAILAIEMSSHENTCSTFLTRAFTSQTMDLSVVIYSVVFKNWQFYFLVLVFDLFWGSVILLLTFLSTTTKTQYQVQGRFYLYTKEKKILLISSSKLSKQGYWSEKKQTRISMPSSTNCFWRLRNVLHLPFWML